MLVTFNEVHHGDIYDIKIATYYTADGDKINKERLYDILNSISEECSTLIKKKLKENGYNIDMFNDITENKRENV